MLIAVMALPQAALFSQSAGAASAASTVTTDDWPTSLHDPMRTSASNDTTFSTSNIAQLVKAWSYQTGGLIASSPTVTGGTAYFGSWDGYEYALDATTGAFKWKTYLGITTANANCNPPTLGITSAAAVLNGVVYVGGGDAYWYALDATSGAVLWRRGHGENSRPGVAFKWSIPLLASSFLYTCYFTAMDNPPLR